MISNIPAASRSMATDYIQTLSLTSGLFLVVEALGLLSAIHALRHIRTAQATTAWCVGLITLPLVVLPLYWVFGRTRFYGYRETIREALRTHRDWDDNYRRRLMQATSNEASGSGLLGRLAAAVQAKITPANRLQILRDGTQTFDAIFADIEAAQSYVLAQFFIIRDDQLGRRFAEVLRRKADQGVEVRLLYDEIGCHALPARYLDDLSRAGVRVASFGTTQGWWNRFQINFRNHRKVVIVDGQVALTGGLNVGDEYVGRSRRFGRWRDTHVRIAGPAVLTVQAIFAGDWYWASREPLTHLYWDVDDEALSSCSANGRVTAVATGPADEGPRCTMMFVDLAVAARRRLWISTPYLVPDEAVATALRVAAARGVDVRLLLPNRSDHLPVYLAGFYYEHELMAAGIEIYRYQHGFLHQKVVLVDNVVATIGSANLDNRSLHLNFELTIASDDAGFVRDVAEMLEDDFANARRSERDYLLGRPLPFRVLVSLVRLFSPVL